MAGGAYRVFIRRSVDSSVRLRNGSGNRAPASQGPMEYCVYLDLCTDLNQRRNPAGGYSHFDGPASVHVERMKCNSDGPLLAECVS